MKLHSFLFLSMLFLPFITFAQQLSSLTLFSENGEKFTLYLDGEQKNPQPMSEMRVRELTRTSYDGRIVFDNPGIPELRGIIKTTTPRGWKADVTYKIETNLQGDHTLRCLGVVPIKDNSRVGSNESSYSGTEGSEDAHYLDYGSPETKTTTVTSSTDGFGNTTIDKRAQSGYDQKDRVSKSAAGCIPMDKNDFERTKWDINGNEMDDQKLMTARNLAINNCFTSEQVLQILNLFSLEKTKLNFAKFAYPQTVDKANYFKVNSAFEAEETKKDLYDYLSRTQ